MDGLPGAQHLEKRGTAATVSVQGPIRPASIDELDPRKRKLEGKHDSTVPECYVGAFYSICVFVFA